MAAFGALADPRSALNRKSLTAPLTKATPKTIRHRLLHIDARITPTGQRLRLDAS